MKIHTNKILKSNPFKVPNDYFEDMQNQIISNIFPHKKKIIQLTPNIIKYVASILIIMSVGIWLHFRSTTKSNLNQWSEIAINNIDSYETELLLSYTDIGEENELPDNEEVLLLQEDITTFDLYNYEP